MNSIVGEKTPQVAVRHRSWQAVASRRPLPPPIAQRRPDDEAPPLITTQTESDLTLHGA